MSTPARISLALPRGLASARARLRLCAGAQPLLRSSWNETSVRRFSTDQFAPKGSRDAAPIPNPDGALWPAINGTASSGTNVLQVQRDLCHIGTVTMKPGNTDINSLIDRIEPVPFLMPHPKTPTAMLLVTPSFASALHSPSKDSAPEAIRQAVSRLLKNSLERATSLRNIRIVAAVVDKLPAPGNGPDTSKGCEGLAYALWFSDKVTRDSWTRWTSLKQDDSVGSLTFDIWDRFRLVSQQGKPQREFMDRIHRLHLPLANTVFQTGKPSIMWNILYSVSEIDALEPGATLEEPRFLHASKINDVKYQRVTWPVSGRYLAHEQKYFPSQDRTLHQLRVPFVPLTAPRRVHASMGNILRQISGPDERPAPASQELEKAVSSYFTATNKAPHAMPVWAIVFSEKSVKYFASAMLGALGKWQPELFSKNYDYAGVLSEYIQETWNTDPNIFQYAIWKSLLRGNAKIHRVLSGGGGWGKKAGLISLDPRRSIVKSPEINFSSASNDDHGPQVDTLEKVAIPGSYIQFFASSASSLDVPEYEPGTSVFGTIPSSIDDTPQTPEGPADIEVWPGWFGALSEQGMSAKYILHESKPGSREHFSQTMIDVPFSLFVTRSKLPASAITKPVTEDSENAESKPSTYSAHNVMRASGLGHAQPLVRRFLHNEARASSNFTPRRYFSAGVIQRYKTKFLVAFSTRRERPMIPISRRLRTLIGRPIPWVPSLQPEDFLMTLPSYKHWWAFNRRFAATCQAECDSRPIIKKKKNSKSPSDQAREKWGRRAQNCREQMERLRQGNIRLLELNVEASEWILNFWKLLVDRVGQQKQSGKKLDKEMKPQRDPEWKKIMDAIEQEQRHVAPLPFRAPEIVEILEELGNNTRVMCKRWEDAVYKIVVRYRKRKRKGTRIATGNRDALKREKYTLAAKGLESTAGTVSGPGVTREAPELRPSASTKQRNDAARTTQEGPPRSGRPLVEYTNRPIPAFAYPGRNAQNQRRDLSTLVIPASTDQSADDHQDVSSHLDILSNSAEDTSLRGQEQDTWSHLDSANNNPRRALSLPDESLATSLEDASEQTPYHLTMAPETRRQYARKRALRFFQLRLVHRSLHRLRLAELAYLDAAVRLSELVCVRLTQHCVAVHPRTWPLEDGLPDTPAGWDADARRNAWLRPRVDTETGERLGEDSPEARLGEGTNYPKLRRKIGRAAAQAAARVAREDDRGALMGAGLVAEEVEWLEAEIGRQRWRVKRLEKKAELGEHEWYSRRVEQFLEPEVDEGGEERGMEAFRAYRDRLVRDVKERLEMEWRNWRKWALVKKVAQMRNAEMVYLEKVIAAWEREWLQLQSEFAQVEYDIAVWRRKMVKNKKGAVKVGQKVRLMSVNRGMDQVMEEKAAHAWALARDLEELLR